MADNMHRRLGAIEDVLMEQCWRDLAADILAEEEITDITADEDVREVKQMLAKFAGTNPGEEPTAAALACWLAQTDDTE